MGYCLPEYRLTTCRGFTNPPGAGLALGWGDLQALWCGPGLGPEWGQEQFPALALQCAHLISCDAVLQSWRRRIPLSSLRSHCAQRSSGSVDLSLLPDPSLLMPLPLLKQNPLRAHL